MQATMQSTNTSDGNEGTWDNQMEDLGAFPALAVLPDPFWEQSGGAGVGCLCPSSFVQFPTTPPYTSPTLSANGWSLLPISFEHQYFSHDAAGTDLPISDPDILLSGFENTVPEQQCTFATMTNQSGFIDYDATALDFWVPNQNILTSLFDKNADSGPGQWHLLDSNSFGPFLPPAPHASLPTVPPAPQVFCTQGCMATFKRDSDRVRHEAAVHGINRALYICHVPGCEKGVGRGYTRKDKLTEHMWKKHAGLGYVKRV